MDPNLSEEDRKKILAQKIVETQNRTALRIGLPFLHGFKWYDWAKKFYDSKNKICLLTAANQISKSSTQIRKCINWATDKDLWPDLWVTQPNLFWYLYPTQDVINIEFETKWKQFLPRGTFQEDPYYGWEVIRSGKDIAGIRFKSGVTVLFKTYGQNVHALQSSTVYAMFCFDGKTPVETADGIKNIEDISKKDVVYTSKGSSCVLNTVSRDANTIIRVLNNGIIIEATPDHYFKTERGEWIQYQDLKEEDILSSQMLNAKSSYSTGFTTSDILSQKTVGITISAMALDILLIDTCTEQSINDILEKYQKDMSFTTKMKMLQIMTLAIWRLYLKSNTHGFTNLKSGAIKEILICIKNLYAKYATQNSNLEQVSELRQERVLKNAEDYLMAQKLIATSVELNISKEKIAEISSKTYVLNGVTDERKNKVYCLKTDTGDFKLFDFIVKNCDEELPIDLFDELIFRLTATDGYFSMVFTATRGQDEWRRAMEPGEHEIEFLPEAFKMTVSMYDCMQYEDGSPSPWTRERILEKEMRCSSHNEILKRIHGKFILDEGALKYESFDHKRHIKDKHPLPKGWNIYVGIDIGSGGAKGHPSAICYLAVNPTFTEGRIFAGWRGDKIITTAGDVVEKNIELKKKLNIRPTRQLYDWGSKDFFTIASRMGEAFEPAEKNHAFGEDLINTLFKNDMLFIYRDDELVKLTIELGSIRKDANKKHAKDDFIDAMRYAASKVPWDFTNLGKKYEDQPVPEAELTPEEASKRKRLEYWEGESQRIADEFAEWNDLYG